MSGQPARGEQALPARAASSLPLVFYLVYSGVEGEEGALWGGPAGTPGLAMMEAVREIEVLYQGVRYEGWEDELRALKRSLSWVRVTLSNEEPAALSALGALEVPPQDRHKAAREHLARLRATALEPLRADTLARLITAAAESERQQELAQALLEMDDLKLRSLQLLLGVR